MKRLSCLAVVLLLLVVLFTGCVAVEPGDLNGDWLNDMDSELSISGELGDKATYNGNNYSVQYNTHGVNSFTLSGKSLEDIDGKFVDGVIKLIIDGDYVIFEK